MAREAIADMQRVGAEMKKLDKQAAEAAKRQQLLGRMAQRTGLALTAFAAAGTVALVSTTRLAARVETLGVVTRRLGENAGLTAEQITAVEKSVKAQGITLRSTRESMALMMQSQIDLTHATDLARMAQDAAVIANVNSSEAFRRLVFVITSGNVRMARTLGLQVSFRDAYKKTAEQLGKTQEELTSLEKTQARTNEVLARGVTIAGTYEAAMTTAGKKVLSLDRHIEESRRIIGEMFLPVMAEAVDTVTEFLQAFEDASMAQQRGVAATMATTVALAGVGGAALLAVKPIIALHGAMTTLGLTTVVTTGGIVLLVAALAGLFVISKKVNAETKILKDEFLNLFKSTVTANQGYDQYLKAAMDAAEGTQLMTNAMRLSEKTGKPLRETFILLASGLGLYDEAQFNFTRGALKAADAFLDVEDAAEKSGHAVLMSADAYVIAQGRVVDAAETSAEAQEQALKATEDAMEGLSFMMDDQLGAATESFIQKQDELIAKAGELRVEIGELEKRTYLTDAQEEELGKLKKELNGISQAIIENRDEHNTTTRQILFDLAAQQLAMADLDPSVQFEVLNTLAVKWGLVGSESKDAFEATNAAILDFLEGGTLAELMATLAALGRGVNIPISISVGAMQGSVGTGVQLGTSGGGGGRSFVPPPTTGGGGSGQQEFAHGGRLAMRGLEEVGELGPEFVLNGVVIPASITKRLKGLGVVASRGFALEIGGGGGGGSGGAGPDDTGGALSLGGFIPSTSSGGGGGGGGTSAAAQIESTRTATMVAAVIEQTMTPALAAVGMAVASQSDRMMVMFTDIRSQQAETRRANDEQIAIALEMLAVLERQGTSDDMASAVSGAVSQVAG